MYNYGGERGCDFPLISLFSSSYALYIQINQEFQGTVVSVSFMADICIVLPIYTIKGLYSDNMRNWNSKQMLQYYNKEETHGEKIVSCTCTCSAMCCFPL